MKILFGVFDWGIGHATRDMPLISKLLEEGHKVDIISTGRPLIVLKEFYKKRCNYFDIPSIYSPYNRVFFSNFLLRFIGGIPKMAYTLLKARYFSKKIISAGNYDLIISDCRYDLYGKKEKSFLINHQLKFKSPYFEWLTEMFLSWRMKKYSCVIVPDYPGNKLSGELSSNKMFKGKVEFIGILSQMKKNKVQEDIDFFITISGPEAEKKDLEQRILKQTKGLAGKKVLAAGSPEINKKKVSSVEYYSFLDTKKQNEMINRAKIIVARAGYTTIMDLVELEKKNILLIPSPGQTEQEYLADLYEKKKYFHHIHQNKLSLKEDLSKIKDYRGFKAPWKTKQSINKFMKIIFSNQ